MKIKEKFTWFLFLFAGLAQAQERNFDALCAVATIESASLKSHCFTDLLAEAHAQLDSKVAQLDESKREERLHAIQKEAKKRHKEIVRLQKKVKCEQIKKTQAQQETRLEHFLEDIENALGVNVSSQFIKLLVPKKAYGNNSYEMFKMYPLAAGVLLENMRVKLLCDCPKQTHVANTGISFAGITGHMRRNHKEMCLCGEHTSQREIIECLNKFEDTLCKTRKHAWYCALCKSGAYGPHLEAVRQAYMSHQCVNARTDHLVAAISAGHAQAAASASTAPAQLQVKNVNQQAESASEFYCHEQISF